MSANYEEIRKALRDLPRTDKFDPRYPIDAYEDDLVTLISNISIQSRIESLSKLSQGGEGGTELFVENIPLSRYLEQLKAQLKESK